MRDGVSSKWFAPLSGTAGVALIVVALVLAATGSPAPAPTAKPVAKAGPVQPASLVQVPSFGADPSHLTMYLYVPNSVRPNPAILVALHWACATGQDFYNGTGFSTLADEYGFIVIYPSVGCWDTDSYAALRRGGGSDPVSVMSMITYTEHKYHADTRRIYVTGASAGGMMTATMLGDYPDVFAAGAVFEGVPFGCPQVCAQVPVTQTPAQWGYLARAADPGYHGPRPRVQIWHGTADENVFYVNFGEEIKQWTNVLGVSQTPLATDHPQQGWDRTVYGTSKNNIEVEAYSIVGAGHVLPEIGMEAYVIGFFGLDR